MTLPSPLHGDCCRTLQFASGLRLAQWSDPRELRKGTTTYFLGIGSQGLHQMLNTAKAINGLGTFILELPVKKAICLTSRGSLKVLWRVGIKLGILRINSLHNRYVSSRSNNAQIHKLNILLFVFHKNYEIPQNSWYWSFIPYHSDQSSHVHNSSFWEFHPR